MRTRGTNRERPEPSKPVYAERPPDPETPDDVRAAGYVIESHWSGWYHWKVANPNGPGATYGVLYETPQEAIGEAREDIALGMTYYPEPEPAAEPEAPQADPQPVYARPHDEIERLRGLLPDSDVQLTLRAALEETGWAWRTDGEYKERIEAAEQWLNRLEGES